MNITVLTEGKGDKKLYNAWIPFINPNLNHVAYIDDIFTNDYHVRSSYGFPYYLDDIDTIINDVNSHGNIDRLVLGLDSEEETLQQRKNRIESHIRYKPCSATIFIVIQHFCIETWALGNRKACSLNPSYAPLVTYKNYFDVRSSDPELLPDYPQDSWNRSQFAEVYLNAMLKSKNSHLTYIKSHPKPLCNLSYFSQIRLRYHKTNHLRSFGMFLQAFS